MRTVQTILLFALLSFFIGCASEKTGLSSNKKWYQPGKSAEQTTRDLAACEAYASASGQGSFMRGEKNGGWAIYDSMSESSRENKIVRNSMIAKGYSMVDKNSPLLSNSQQAQSSPSDDALASELLGHWTSVSSKGSEVTASQMEITFFSDKKLLAKSIWLDHGVSRTNVLDGNYLIKGGRMYVSDNGSSAEPWLFHFDGDGLILKPVQMDAETRFMKAR